MVPLYRKQTINQRQNLDVFDYVPLTFSFRIHEPTFFDDLQNFARLFIALSKGVRADAISAIDKYKDKYGNSHEVYFNFDLRIPQRACTPAQMPKFKNIKASQVNLLPEFDSKKNLWILKPSWMSRGRGLELFTELKELEKFLQMYICGYDAKDYKQLKYNHTLERSPSLTVSNSRVSSTHCLI
jgi:Tubulin-tyrosine ligase family